MKNLEKVQTRKHKIAPFFRDINRPLASRQAYVQSWHQKTKLLSILSWRRGKFNSHFVRMWELLSKTVLLFRIANYEVPPRAIFGYIQTTTTLSIISEIKQNVTLFLTAKIFVITTFSFQSFRKIFTWDCQLQEIIIDQSWKSQFHMKKIRAGWRENSAITKITTDNKRIINFSSTGESNHKS